MSLATARAGGHGRPPNRLSPPAVVLIVLVIGGAAAQVFGSRLLEVYRLDREAARLEALKRDFQEQNAILREEIKLLATPQYIEKLAREQLGLVKPGEVAILIVQPRPHSPATPARRQQDSRSPVGRLWRSLLRWIR